MRKVVPGTSDRSFGIHAARIAGLPPVVLKRASDILESLELRRDLLKRGVDVRGGEEQFGLFDPASGNDPTGPPTADPLRDAVAGFDLETASPMEAFDFVRRLKDDV